MKSTTSRFLTACVAGAVAVAFYALHFSGIHLYEKSGALFTWYLGTLALIVSSYEILAIGIVHFVRMHEGPEGEIRMLTRFLKFLAVLAAFLALLYTFGVLSAVSATAGAFAGMLLGWSLQAPVSGLAAWVLVTLYRPFRVNDRVYLPSWGLLGDVRQVGAMYTVLNQVGGSVGSEEAVGRSILIPNAVLFSNVMVNYTPAKQEASYILDEVIIRITYDSNWEAAEQILLRAARAATADIIAATGKEPYIRSDMYDYGVYLRLRFMTLATDRPRITHEITKFIFREVQQNPEVDFAIPYVYSVKKGAHAMPRAEVDNTNEDEKVADLDVNEILPPTDAPSTPAVEQEIAELMDRIRQMGLLQPIVVERREGGRYAVIAGQRRFEACRRLGYKRIPAVVRERPN